MWHLQRTHALGIEPQLKPGPNAVQDLVGAGAHGAATKALTL